MLVLALSVLPVVVAAQNPATQGVEKSRSTPAPALSGVMGIDSQVPEENTISNLPQIPALLGGPSMSLAFRSESERSNYLRGGLNVGAAYDDNAVLTPTGQNENTTFSVFPNIRMEQTRSRMSWTLGYAAGLTVNQRISSRNQGSQDLNFDSQFRLSPHVNLRVAEDFSLTAGFFNSGNGAGFGVGSGGPNASLITPLAKQRSSSTVAEANYHFALKDVVGTSGSFYNLHFNDVPAGWTLTNSRGAAASAFWLHGLFGRDWAGLSYRFQRMTFDPSGEARVHSILVVDTISLPGGFALTGFVGPEYYDNQGLVPVAGGGAQAVHFRDWSVAGGAEVGWQREHTSLVAGYSRRITDGGGVLGVVRLQSVHGDLRQELFPGWAVAVGGMYGNNNSLAAFVAGSAASAEAASVRASLERNIGNKLGLRLGYTREFQNQIGSTDPALQGAAHRNLFFVTVGYQWARPLGR